MADADLILSRFNRAHEHSSSHRGLDIKRPFYTFRGHYARLGEPAEPFLALVASVSYPYNFSFIIQKPRFTPMTIDKSLKIKAGGIKQRNVMTRGERLERLAATDRWQEGDSVLGIPKVRVQKLAMKKKKKVKEVEEGAEDAASGAETTEK